MANTQEDRVPDFVPAEVFPPGAIIKEELEARDWTQEDLAAVMDRPLKTINKIIKAKTRITEETAKELEAAFGIDADVWLRTEAFYRLHQTDDAPRAISQRAALRRRVPLRHMLSRGWLAQSDDDAIMVAGVLTFLGVDALEEKSKVAFAAKQAAYDEAATPTQEVWLLRVRQLAETMRVAKYTPETLADAIGEMEPLLRSPDEARHVSGILADAGVRFVVVEQLPGLKTDGVCTWLDGNAPVIGMSLMRDRIDNFWFGLRHECEHVLNGDGKDAPILDNDFDAQANTSEREGLANAAAAEFCVPQHLMDDFVARKGPLYADEDIRNFARLHGRHPGLVAGQLRYRLGAYNKYTKHLARIRHAVLTSATTDGFGQYVDIN